MIFCDILKYDLFVATLRLRLTRKNLTKMIILFSIAMKANANASPKDKTSPLMYKEGLYQKTLVGFP